MFRDKETNILDEEFSEQNPPNYNPQEKAKDFDTLVVSVLALVNHIVQL